ncbi:phospholipase D-like domain-containing protein [Dermatophilus congolensis]|uniref:phospholipase D-like domain-containing protein n=1 Tax=Dermatophilus congolensis TaxID=1863 RepID=UPI001FBA8FE9|nr:phospholipase D-like domain-containing protein [Dermatophilus congolensis]
MSKIGIRRSPSLVMGHAVKVAAVTSLTIQAGTVAGLIAFDAYKKRGRRKRVQFTRPGTFENRVGENGVQIFTYGADLYEEMISDIEKAKHSILLETYLWKSDEVGTRFRDALNDAARRGVEVKVIFDGMGNLVVNPFFYKFDPSVQVFRLPIFRPQFIFNPIDFSGLTHRKMLIVDHECAYVGGYNLGSLYATQWRDTHVKLTGPETWELQHSFRVVWNRLAARGRGRDVMPRIDSNEAWDSKIRSVDNIPARRTYPIRSMYLSAIDKADNHIFLTTAYFIPDQQVLDALIQASQRGVDVRILIPKDSNHILADFVSRGYWRRLLDAGVTVLLYEDAMIHAKTMTVDGKWSTIGTANIDRLSLSFNYEVNTEITDAGVAASMEKIFHADAGNAHALTREEWQQRHRLARFAEIVVAPFAPLM